MNSRKENLGEALDTVLANQPLDRTAELERRVAELEKDVALLKSVSSWPLLANEASNTEKKKPGPKEKISDEELFRYRDGLILWLEPFWPWMTDRLVAARTVAEIAAILEAVAPEPDCRAGWHNRILQNAVVLCEFLWDERFRKTLPRTTLTDALTLHGKDERRWRAANQLPTRQIANAMAGVPDLGWRRSLDRCSKRPSTIAVALNSDLYYRDRLGMPAPKGLDLTRLWSGVPKFVQPVLAGSSNQPKQKSGGEANFAAQSPS